MKRGEKKTEKEAGGSYFHSATSHVAMLLCRSNLSGWEMKSSLMASQETSRWKRAHGRCFSCWFSLPSLTSCCLAFGPLFSEINQMFFFFSSAELPPRGLLDRTATQKVLVSPHHFCSILFSASSFQAFSPTFDEVSPAQPGCCRLEALPSRSCCVGTFSIHQIVRDCPVSSAGHLTVVLFLN